MSAFHSFLNNDILNEILIYQSKKKCIYFSNIICRIKGLMGLRIVSAIPEDYHINKDIFDGPY